MVAGAFFFSLMSLLVKLAGQRLPSQEIVLARSLVMATLSYVALRRRRIRVLGTRRRLLVLRGLLGFGALSCFYFALVHLPLADATVIQYTNPAFTAVFAVFVLAERMRRREVACLALTLLGVVLVARPAFIFGSGALPGVPTAVALLGAILSAAAYVVVRMLGSEHHLVVIFYFAVISSVGAVPGTLMHSVLPTGPELLLLAGVGVTTHLGQIFMTRGLHLERAGRATAAGLVQIVFAGVLGAIFFAQIPDPPALAGAALVIAGVLLLGRG
jgi:drug/metabolite transporter (DMT)-like permease